MGIRKDNVEPILILLNIRCVYKYVCNERIMRVERIYDSPRGGVRVLVDRLWPRGISKDAAVLNKWAKELTPSTELRKAYHDGMVWQEFKIAYMLELEMIQIGNISMTRISSYSLLLKKFQTTLMFCSNFGNEGIHLNIYCISYIFIFLRY